MEYTNYTSVKLIKEKGNEGESNSNQTSKATNSTVNQLNSKKFLILQKLIAVTLILKENNNNESS